MLADKQGKLFTFKELTDFPTEVRKYIKNNPKCSNRDLYEFGLTHGYLPKHMRKILLQFLAEGILQVTSDSQEKVPKGAFYLSYNNHSPFETKMVHFNIVED